MSHTGRTPEFLFRIFLVLSICGHPGCYDSTVNLGGIPDALDYTEDRYEPPPDMADATDDIPMENPVDLPVEEIVHCPPDNPPEHTYINVDGTVISLDGTRPLAGTFAGAISPLDALTNPEPTALGSSPVAADGAFSIECLDVGPVALGLVILHDDDPADPSSDDYYPTGTWVKDWLTVEEKVDISGAAVFALSRDLAAAVEAMAPVDIDTDGLAMGIVVGSDSGLPIDGAEVVSLEGEPLDVVYPAADFTGLETDGDTSASGVFIIAQPVYILVTDVTALAPGYSFDQHALATKEGFIFFIVIAGTPG